MSQTAEQPPRPPRALVATNHLYLLMVVGLATTLMLQTMRVFTSSMVFVIDQANRVELALTVFATFGAIALGGVLLKTVKFRRSMLIGAFLFGAGRLAIQFLELPDTRLIIGAIAMAAWGWLMLAIFRHWRESAAIGVGFGIALDLAIRIAGSTRDLTWNPGEIEHLVTVVLVVGMLVGVAAIRGLHIQQLPEYSTRNVWSLAAFGPGIALYFIVTGNLGLAQVSTGLNIPEAAFLLALGTALGLRFSIFAGEFLPSSNTGRVTTGPLIIAIFLAMGLFLIGQGGIASAPGMILASAAGVVLLGFAVAGRESTSDVEPPLLHLTLAFTGGMLLKVGMLFLYYMYSGVPLMLGVIAGAFVLLAIPAGVPDTSRPIHQPRAVLIGAGAMAGVLALVTAWQLLTFQQAEAGPPAEDQITVMTYNIQNGFDLDNRFDLEAIADTIEAEDADVVVIQEIGRGWLVTADFDQVTWLSNRLDMPYVYGANSDDALWGNAIFTRLPILESDTTQYSDTDNLKRGAIEVAVDTASGPVWIYGTHLDNPSDADDVRFSQGRELIEFWDGKTPAMVLGDLNAEPDDALLAEFDEAGLRDLGVDLPDGAFTSPGGRRIDYILATEDLDLVDIHITEVWTSDHLPVIATVSLPDED
jgi:endonuclease/exonuclease/phosphatase family metal-dependent hydrolase